MLRRISKKIQGKWTWMSWTRYRNLRERFLKVILYWIVDLKLEFQCDIMILTKNLKRIHRFFYLGHSTKICYRERNRKLYRNFCIMVVYMSKQMDLRLNLKEKGLKEHMILISIVLAILGE
jgi:hypothetical protein